MPYYKKLVGKRCYLSPIDPEDSEIYTRWLNDLETTRCLTLSSIQITLHGEKDMLKEISKRHEYAIVTMEGDILIGGCGFTQIDQIRQSGEAGIFIGDCSYRGKGYGTEALTLLLGYGFDYLNLHSVMLRVYEFNKQAIACYTKMGFAAAGRRREAVRLEGTWYDEIIMDILEGEYRTGRQNR